MEKPEEIKKQLAIYANPDQIEEKFKYFHKTSEGGYAQKDKFIGVTVPNIRIVAKKYYEQISLKEIEKLLHSPYHEHRLTALIIATYKMKKEKQEPIVELYLKNTAYVNGWDLVDMSAPYILGQYLLDKEDRNILYQMARSNSIWEQRIAMVSTWILIKHKQYIDTLQLAEILLNTTEDLIQKAVGWMLREVGKRNYQQEHNFLLKHYKNMPRTMLRYAIEKYPEEIRKQFLKGTIEV